MRKRRKDWNGCTVLALQDGVVVIEPGARYQAVKLDLKLIRKVALYLSKRPSKRPKK